jgi:hypothetical protein
MTDTPSPETVTATIPFGQDANLLGLLGPYNCTGGGSESGGTLKVTATSTLACTEGNSSNTSWTGTISWDDGSTSQVTTGTNPENNRDHADGTVRLDGMISGGHFSGHTLAVELADSSGSSGNCEGSGVTSTAGTAAVIVS